MNNRFSEFFLALTSRKQYKEFRKCRDNLVSPFSDGDYPTADRSGNAIANIGVVSIMDYFCRTCNIINQERIKRNICISDQLVLVPVRDGINEIREIAIFTLFGKRIGRLPDDGEFTDAVRRRLIDNHDIFAQVFNYYLLHNGRLNCDIRIVYYEVPDTVVI